MKKWKKHESNKKIFFGLTSFLIVWSRLRSPFSILSSREIVWISISSDSFSFITPWLLSFSLKLSTDFPKASGFETLFSSVILQNTCNFIYLLDQKSVLRLVGALRANWATIRNKRSWFVLTTYVYLIVNLNFLVQTILYCFHQNVQFILCYFDDFKVYSKHYFTFWKYV